MTVIGIVHPGSMGAAVGRALVDAGHDAAWASDGRSDATAAAAASAGLRDVGTIDQLARQCDLVVSLCPPHAAAEVAEQFAGYRGTFVEANAVSPATVRHIGERLTPAILVDAAVIGPPPDLAGTTRLYLSGPADEVALLLHNDRFEIHQLAAGPTAASALKMTYAAWSKGSQALMLAIRGAAVELGVEQDLLAEWFLSQPGLTERSDRAKGTPVERGWRWSHELAEVGRTFAAADQPAGFGEAAAEVFGRFGRPAS
ncbi:3-hydroxyisobutyrate dehydrogenase-like beta-hydroxyacid dehydrogenase [Nakamurella sp. UYEF19]|uniref:NAD(P)-dependent oxidoreductase n=1 Tax=Nakamurella sp. UYEF19 TaxID=1756392 RepID=UPI003396927B